MNDKTEATIAKLNDMSIRLGRLQSDLYGLCVDAKLLANRLRREYIIQGRMEPTSTTTTMEAQHESTETTNGDKGAEANATNS